MTQPASPDETLQLLQRRAQRERQAREEAERLLEDKSLALYEANRVLRAQAEQLEQQVHLRTQELSAALESARSATRHKTEFLANISHELRTPLHAIVGLTRLLTGTALKDEQKEYVSLIESSSQALMALLNDVLDFSKIEAGKLVFERIRFDLPHWVQDAAAPHAFAARGKGLEFRLDVSPNVPNYVVGDPGRLRQVISNLLSNAVKFTRRGSIELSVVDAGSDAQAVRLLFRVKDSGVGIPAEQQAHIFDAFTQADASTTRQFGGTGLGLAICSRLVTMMGGRIKVRSELNRGSVFGFTAVFEQSLVDTEPALLPGEGTERILRGVSVLVAEDNRVNQLLMKKLLEPLGAKVRFAENGRIAFKAWESGGLDLILMDVQMPDLNGMDATRLIRQAEAQLSTRRTPIVALTAHAMPGDREMCLASGMDAYVSKPVSLEALCEAIAEAQAKCEQPMDMLSDLIPLASRPAAQSAAKAGVPAVDRSKLLRSLGNDEEIQLEMAAAMRHEINRSRHVMQQAVLEKNAVVLKEHAHSLKGALASFCAETAAQEAAALERALRAQDWLDCARIQVRLDEALDAVVAEIGQIMGDAAGRG